MKKILILLFVTVFAVSAFADIMLNSAPIRETEKTNHSFYTRDILYEQLANLSAEGGVSSQDFETGYDNYDAEGADDFVVPAGETWTINEIAILGSFSAGGPCELANVRFFADAEGMPGTLLFEYLNVPANFDVDGNFDCIIEDTILSEGTYWVGVQARLDMAVGGQWFWSKQVAPTIDAEFHWQNPGDGFGSGYTTWVTASIQWPAPDYYDHNLSFGIYGTSGSPEEYPVSFGESNDYEWITNVTFASINNTTAADAGGYGDYTAMVADVVIGDTHDLSTTIEFDSNDYITAWIDWNHDYDFIDAGEEYIIVSAANANGPFTVPVTVPAGAFVGETRMRVSVKWNGAPLSDEVFSYGEVEDYTLCITEPASVYTLPFAEDFEGEVIPADWTMTTNSIGWFVSLDGSSEYWVIPAGTGYYACSNDDGAGSAGDGSMDYLKTPEFDLTGVTGTTLTFDSYYTGDYGEIATVEASTDGTNWTIVNTLTSSASGVWDPIVVDLSAYDGESSVWFAFHADDAGNWASGWAFDTVSITGEAAPEPPAVFFSEYIEGSSNNKAIEIYNGTGADIDLSDYAVVRYNNGNSAPGDENLYVLDGTLIDADVYVMGNASADPIILAVSDILSEVTYYNGDDYLGLIFDANGDDVFDNATEVIDVIGLFGEDPGSGWDVAGVTEATGEHTLVRKEIITMGNTDWALSAGTTVGDSEWEVYDVDTFDYLGQHPGMGGGTFDSPESVSVDDELGIVSWYPPANTLIFEDFEAYSVGDYFAEVNTDWTTWSNLPGTAEDGVISDDHALSPTNSLLITGTNDQVLILDNYTSGIYSMEVNLYIPTGQSGYWNLLTNFDGAASEWGFQILFENDGVATADAGAAAALVFDYDFDTWINMKAVVNLNADWCDIYVDGDLVIGYQWTLGTFGDPVLQQLGAMNIFAAGLAPMCYFDDIEFKELVPATDELTNFNVYLNDMVTPVATVGADVMEYTYAGLVDGVTYMAGVSAVYDDPGESEIIEVEFEYTPITTFDPPVNPTASVVNYNAVELMWEAPSGAAEWMSWDTGINDLGNAIGLTAAGSFFVASHWNPADLVDYDGAEITKIEFLPSELETFIMHVWTGPNAGTLVSSEPVTTVDVGEYQEVELSSPVTIDASQELWFGYEVIQAGLTHPAGTDDGPAVQELGDMISLDGTSWTGMSAAYDLDYNWLLAAYVEGADGEAIVLSKPRKTSKTINATSRSLGIERNPFSCVQTSNVRDTRSLAGYKVYQDGLEVVVVPDPATLTCIVDSLDAGTYEFTITAYYTNPDEESVPTAPVTVEIVLNPPANLAAQSIPPNISVTWDVPARGIDNYNIYRNGDLHAQGVTGGFYIDALVPTGTYLYKMTTVYEGGFESGFSPEVEVVHVGGDDILKPTVTALTGNYPNPFNPTTTISFSIKEAGPVSVNIYNMRGQLVKTLVNSELENDYYEIVWTGRDNSNKSVASGVYFYKMKTQDYNSIKKMILMK